MIIAGIKIHDSLMVSVRGVRFRIYLDCASTDRAVLVIDAPREVAIHKEETLKKELPQ